MLEKLDLSKILFLDIETVPQLADYASLDEDSRALWDHKAAQIGKEGQAVEEVYERAGIYAEFGKVVCISVGVFHTMEGGRREFRVRSYFGHDERELLLEFAAMCDRHFSKADHLLCGHNGKEFDFPYMARRMVINRVRIPKILQMTGKKPWEVRHLDTMELWKFGDRKSFTSLKLLTHVLGIPTPKTDIDGKDVARVYYVEKDLDRIERYCKRDTVAVAQVLLRFRGEELLSEDEIVER
jgi:3'-5' exonuclease